MLWALSFLFLFTIGGLTGLFLGTLNVDVHLHDTYFVVAHFHYVMVGGTVMGFVGGLHYWWPKMTGKHVQRELARASAGSSCSSASTSRSSRSSCWARRACRVATRTTSSASARCTASAPSAR